MRNLHGIRTKLALVVLACVIPTVVGFGVIFGHFYRSEQAQFERDNITSARAMVRAVDRDLSSSKMAALALATSPSLAANALAAFHAEASSLLIPEFPGFSFVLSDTHAQQRVNTLVPFGTPLPRHALPEQVRRVVGTGKPVVSDLFISAMLHRPIVSVEVPVWRNRQVVFTLRVGILPERLGNILSEQQLAPSHIGIIVDSRGVIVARTKDAERFVGKMASSSMLEPMHAGNEGAFKGVTLEGIPVYTFFSRSAISGWTVAIGVPLRDLSEARWNSIAWIGWMVIALCSSGFALAWFMGGKIGRSVMALASSSSRDNAIHDYPMAFREAEIVARTLEHQRHLVEERTRELSADIAERKRVEAQLSIANARYAENYRFLHVLIDNLPGLVSYWDSDLRCRFANRRYIGWFKRTPEEMTGMHAKDVLGEKLFLLNEPYFQKALLSEPQNFERTMAKANGEIAHVWVNYIPDIDVDGNVVGIFALISDVTILKQSEEGRRIAATAFESSEAMMITDADSIILRVNHAFSEVTGYSSEEIVGRNPRILQSGRHDQAFYVAMWEGIRRCESWKGELWNRRKNGQIYPTWTTITAVRDETGAVTHYVGTQTDITEAKAAEEEIAHLAFFDVLTGLPNRRLLMDRLRHAFASCIRTRHNGALMFIDLDNFKEINDTLGHDKGDLLLQQAAARLSGCVREGDTVARLGGDEFMVLLDNLSESAEEAGLQTETVGEKIRATLNEAYDLTGIQYRGTASIGMTLFTDHQSSIEELLKRADIAMYQAKAAGRNALRFFDAKLQAIVMSHIALDAEFRQALLKMEFVLYFQAQVDQERELIGVEVLVRWQHPQRGLLLPAEFIDLAEETGLILDLGHWVLETACCQLATWGEQPETAHLTMSVNVSALQFRSASYVSQVLSALEKTGANPRKLKLEITESLLLDDVESIIDKMTALKSHGISFSLDDFGTGYSSLTYLKRLPLDQLKIDQSFVSDIMTDTNDATIATAIVALGHNLELDVIAEGVETEDQWQFLEAHNCKAYQGYLFGHPLPLLKFEETRRLGCADKALASQRLSIKSRYL
ncbi:MAG TPA: EAL domain-containing protein [Duganella sp.]|nr:EAL domain-containing protein [Duganella sp.]